MKLSLTVVFLVALLLALGAFSFLIPLSPRPKGASASGVQPAEVQVPPAAPKVATTAAPVSIVKDVKDLFEGGPPRLTLATGADSGYFRGLVNIVGSVQFWCPECRIVVFNLGLSEQQLNTVRSWCNVTLEWAEGMPKINGETLQPKQYAWKPMAILHAVVTYKVAMWLDAGCSVSGPLMPTVGKILFETGHFTVQGQDLDSSRWCHEGTLDAFGLKKADMEGKPSFAGGVAGFSYQSPAYYDILLPWVHCAGRPSCITPAGSSLANHRFDQCVLSVLSHHSKKVNVTPHTELLAYTSAQLRPCFEASEMVIWTARQGESCYASKVQKCPPKP